MTRRPDGTLEADILRILWTLGRPATPGDVRDRLEGDLAYTSVATVLGRLCDKQLVRRRREGRAYVYEPLASEADLAGERIRTVLAAVDDRHAALAGFVRKLDPDDAAALRRLLENLR